MTLRLREGDVQGEQTFWLLFKKKLIEPLHFAKTSSPNKRVDESKASNHATRQEYR